MKLTGIILAAGESRRMGSPKALLDLGGEIFLDRLIDVLGSSCSPVIVVLGSEAQRIRGGLRNAGRASFVLNPDYARGQLSSLQCGLAAVPVDADGVMFMPVDKPAVLGSSIAAIARRFEERKPGELLVVPRAGGRNGHPVLVSRELVQQLLALPHHAQARDVIHGHVQETVYLDVDDAGVLDDVNDPEAYAQLKARWGNTV
ncbi:MAG TPA: nucleotidyltransferase family protein [Bryobacteraceae bacterium]|nr:nucleotidyltransferase family protein [Bryobacteraceae bacterium]